jgi:hypothetical protein
MSYTGLHRSERIALRKAYAGQYGLFINATLYFNAMYLTPVKEWVS